MHHLDLQSPVLQSAGGLQAKQSTADHHGFLLPDRVVDHGGAVVTVAESEHPRRWSAVGQHSVDRGEEGAAAGGDDEPVVTHRRSAIGLDGAGEPVDPDHRIADPQVDAVLGVPVGRVEKDPIDVIGAGKYVGQQDAVVVAVGLIAKDGDVKQVRSVAAQDFLHGAHTGHSVADHDQPLLVAWRPGVLDRVVARRRGHCRVACGWCHRQTSTKPRSTIAVPLTSSGAATKISMTVSASRSSRTRNTTFVAPLAAIGK